MFQFHYVIGRGAYGKVWKVVRKNNGEQYAIKEMAKAEILAKGSHLTVVNERRLLSKLRSP
jgi:protein kinase A